MVIVSSSMPNFLRYFFLGNLYARLPNAYMPSGAVNNPVASMDVPSSEFSPNTDHTAPERPRISLEYQRI